jgi:hypothetical protein
VGNNRIKKVFGKAGGRSIGVHLSSFRPFRAGRFARTGGVIAISAMATLATPFCVWAGQSPTLPADAALMPDAPAPQVPVAGGRECETLSGAEKNGHRSRSIRRRHGGRPGAGRAAGRTTGRRSPLQN